MGLFQIPHSANSRVRRTCGSTWLPPTSSRGGRLTRTAGDNQSLLQVQLIVKLAQLRTTIIFFIFFSLYPTNCETSTAGDNQRLLQILRNFFWNSESSTTKDNNDCCYLFLYIQPIVKLAQLATTRACFKSCL